jgi:hypothetical protein
MGVGDQKYLLDTNDKEADFPRISCVVPVP